jgi:hypothetical protein
VSLLLAIGLTNLTQGLNAYFKVLIIVVRLMRVINFENLHILIQNHSFTIPIDNGR